MGQDNHKPKDTQKGSEPKGSAVKKDFGYFGKIEKINLAGRDSDIEYMIYAQVAAK